ncbi:MAG: hypothetical protein PUC05_03110, partial [Firmicutes bacterium]|nr:hypothetical protein [Bacillota bacterium]
SFSPSCQRFFSLFVTIFFDSSFCYKPSTLASSRLCHYTPLSLFVNHFLRFFRTFLFFFAKSAPEAVNTVNSKALLTKVRSGAQDAVSKTPAK